MIYLFALAQVSVQVNVLLNNCKQNMTSLSLLAGRTVLCLVLDVMYQSSSKVNRKLSTVSQFFKQTTTKSVWLMENNRTSFFFCSINTLINNFVIDTECLFDYY